MSSNILVINDISARVIELSSNYSTNKAFLNKCGINNKSLITDLKYGRVDAPGAQILEQIVLGTGCSGTWLLTGEGEMFEARKNTAAEPEGGGYRADLNFALGVIERLEQRSVGQIDTPPQPGDALKVARLLVTLLERQQDFEKVGKG